MDSFLILDLQKGNAEVATLELQRGPNKDNDKNFERRHKEYEKADVRVFCKELKDCWEKQNRIQN